MMLPLRRPRRGAPLLALPALCLALLAAAFVLPRLAGAAGPAAPAHLPSPSLVFSEVYAPAESDPSAQWFELRNVNPNTKVQIPLNGLILATARNQVTLSTTQVITGGSFTLFVFAPDAVAKGLVTPAKGATVIAVPELGGLAPNADALILKPPIGSAALVIDEINWGPPLPAWVNYTEGLWNQALLR